MNRDIIIDILDFIKREEILKAQEKIERVLLQQAYRSWESRFKKVHEINRGIMRLKQEHRWYQESLKLIPEEKRKLAQLQLREIENNFYVRPLKILKREKQKISQS